jgi:hypothetical protein
MNRSVSCVLAACAAAAALAGTAQAAAPTTMPTALPADAAAAGLTVTQRVFTTFRPTGSTGGGFIGTQTIRVAAPRGRTIIQGFATMTGGPNTGSAVIRSTLTTGREYRVDLRFPGEQGRPGRLVVQIQTVPLNP